MLKLSRSRLTALAGLVAVSLGAASPSKVDVTKAGGGSIKTALSSNIILNEHSTLQREWIAITHANMPAKLKGTPGIKTIYESGRSSYSGEYQYVAQFEFDASEPITAIEIRFLTFDVWGERQKSLVLTEIEDFNTGSHALDGKWNLYSENEASKYYASIAYVSRVRTKDGRVLSADPAPVIEEAKKFYAKFSESDLEPEKPIKPAK